MALIFVGGEPEATVSSIEDLDPGAGPRPIVFVPLDPGGDRAWLKRLGEELEDELTPRSSRIPERLDSWNDGPSLWSRLVPFRCRGAAMRCVQRLEVTLGWARWQESC